jgi:hypothetical protein
MSQMLAPVLTFVAIDFEVIILLAAKKKRILPYAGQMPKYVSFT